MRLIYVFVYQTSCLFTEKALKDFLKKTGFQYVIRAHECQVYQIMK